MRLAAWVGLVILAGCADAPAKDLSDAQLLSSFSDADHRFAESAASDHETTHSFVVPQSHNQIRIRAAYRSEGDGSFVLRMPDGNGAHFDTFSEAKRLEPGPWYERRDPPVGRWSFNAHLTDGGAYAFGVYMG